MAEVEHKTEESGDIVPEVRTMITRRPTLTRRMTIEEEHMGEYFVWVLRMISLFAPFSFFLPGVYITMSCAVTSETAIRLILLHYCAILHNVT
ncbi:hypothetical protein ANCDUO_04870 [Ancylostoma duodenale]|uniref:Uncharacterized protein n=1 Tax=Ancylostoma duodenale TaxID=51022 RepID=A0A0C2D5G3_9BILA|nr:hypothetical protein ANCDUO_04870 [Ancylostoma duodenale]